jgi:hypothetical protein
MTQADRVSSTPPLNTPIDLRHHPMCPPPRPTWDLVDKVDQQLHELKWMGEFALELAQQIHRAESDDYYRLQEEEGERLSFVIGDILRRVEEALEALAGKAVRS